MSSKRGRWSLGHDLNVEWQATHRRRARLPKWRPASQRCLSRLLAIAACRRPGVQHSFRKGALRILLAEAYPLRGTLSTGRAGPASLRLPVWLADLGQVYPFGCQDFGFALLPLRQTVEAGPSLPRLRKQDKGLNGNQGGSNPQNPLSLEGEGQSLPRT